jgi:serine/threonine protein kinase
MLGSCTSELHNGELWLLLEFCPHGDLKTFIIKHREEFMSSITNQMPVSNLDARLFLKWAHSIAKGMDYLSSKRIMHGDLAARNILIGGLEGGANNFVAKVSDFGLSKTFYDNLR